MFFYARQRKRERQTRGLREELVELNTALREGFNTDGHMIWNSSLQHIANARYDYRNEIPRSELNIDKLLGHGYYGSVYKGTYKNFGVAIKMLKNSLNIEQFKSLVCELKILSNLGAHQNIVNLVGACTTRLIKCELLIVVELCERGNLKDFLMRSSRSFHSDLDTPLEVATTPSITKRDLLRFCQQIAVGMEFLSSKSVSIVIRDSLIDSCVRASQILHRDLAARNVLITADYTIKLCDFGLARNLYGRPFYQVSDRMTRLPLVWMAIESFTRDTFSTQSDVWSFGVCCWEIFSLGLDPYDGVEDIRAFILSGGRLEQPVLCMDNVFEVIESCWNKDSEARPTFTGLVEAFNQFSMPRVIVNANNAMVGTRYVDPSRVDGN